MEYLMTDIHPTPALCKCTKRKRRDAAMQELWRVVREALSDYGLCDTKHAWNLYRQWQETNADRTMDSAKFDIVEGRFVTFMKAIPHV